MQYQIGDSVVSWKDYLYLVIVCYREDIYDYTRTDLYKPILDNKPVCFDSNIKLFLDKEFTDRERTIILGRFMNNLTYKAIGEKVNLSCNRVRQITLKLIKRLANDKIWSVLNNIPTNSVQQKSNSESGENLYNLIKSKRYKIIVPENIYNLGIDYLDLKVRVANSVRRYGVNIIGDFNNMDLSEILKFRNMGKVGFIELVDSLMQYVNLVEY